MKLGEVFPIVADDLGHDVAPLSDRPLGDLRADGHHRLLQAIWKVEVVPAAQVEDVGRVEHDVASGVPAALPVG